MPGPGRDAVATLVVVTGIDADGDVIARPVDWADGPAPTVFMRPERRDQPALVPGDRVLASLRSAGRGRLEGRTLRRATTAPGRLLGVFRPHPGGGGRLDPVDRNVKSQWRVPPGQEGGAAAGELVLATPLPHGGFGLTPAAVRERLGPAGAVSAISRIAVHANAIPTEFTAAALSEAAACGPVAAAGREDLRAIPLVTVDGPDARDFDDAVWAERDGEGFRLLVAIADVAAYVPPGSALDTAARERGNSVYFPDRVVPMLPAALSDGWCSLLPGEDRPCVAVFLSVDAAGRKTSHRFTRAVMRSRARLTYAGLQAMEDAGDDAVAPLFAAAAALLDARRRRGALELDTREWRVLLDGERVRAVEPVVRLGSHRLIEALMVLANVAAAEELERLGRPCLYRVHPPPSEPRLQALASAAGIDKPTSPQAAREALKAVAGTPEAGLLAELMLRSQSQAAYAAENGGHFGLALPRYAHFTSPIRRYADLLVHRALLGQPVDLDGVGRHLTATEARASRAEADARERYLARLLVGEVGRVWRARVTGLQRFGIFATVDENGATGLVPTSSLPDDLFVYDSLAQTLSGRRTRMTFRLAQDIDVRLVRADALTGALSFELVHR